MIKTPFELFGYECKEGWLPLIEKAKDAVDKWNEEHKDDKDFTKLEFTQVKEKWGLLCIYLNYYPDGFFEFLSKLEKESASICEACGKKEDRILTSKVHGWYMSLCDDCKAEELERYENLMSKK